MPVASLWTILVALDGQDAASYLVQGMFGRAAQKLVQAMGLDPAHHNHIHMLLIGERAQHRDRVPFNEVTSLSGHAMSVSQVEKGLFMFFAQLLAKIRER